MINKGKRIYGFFLIFNKGREDAIKVFLRFFLSFNKLKLGERVVGKKKELYKKGKEILREKRRQMRISEYTQPREQKVR